MNRYMVYVMRNVSDAVLYVGATVRGETRIDEHRRNKPWFGEVAKIEREYFATPKEAGERERALLSLHKPPHVGRHTAYGHVPSKHGAPNGFVALFTLAERLGVGSATLRQQIARNRLIAIKRNRDWYVPDEEVARYEREHLGKRGTASPRYPHKTKGDDA